MIISAYLDGEINFGKAAEMLSMHELELRDRFVALGIPLRIGPTNKAEAKTEVEVLNSWFSRDDSE
ncbi:MAG: hypothetical protein DWQ04_26835 [Chloroflexi bacterium]|nr:MAG: hypothetical protein DWQ04_26835 [Chloroflexota bacterium]